MEIADEDAPTQSSGEEPRGSTKFLDELKVTHKKLEIELAKDKIKTNEVRRRHYLAKMKQNLAHEVSHAEKERSKAFFHIAKTLIVVAVASWLFQLYLWPMLAMDQSFLDRIISFSNNGSNGTCGPTRTTQPHPSPPLANPKNPTPVSTELATPSEPSSFRWIKEKAAIIYEKSKEHLTDATQKAQDFLEKLDTSAFTGWFSSALSSSKVALVSLTLVALAVVIRLLKIPLWLIGAFATGLLSLGHRDGLIILVGCFSFEVVISYLFLRTGLIVQESRMDRLLLHRPEIPNTIVACIAALTGFSVGFWFE